MELFFVDKVLPFLKKNQSLEQLEKLTLFQFYLLRFGIGLTITKKIIHLSGVHFSYRIKNYIPTLINQNIKFIFIKTTNMLDLYLQQKMVERIKLDIKLYSYRGDRYNLRLPLHGQRRRANSKTVKKVRLLIL